MKDFNDKLSNYINTAIDSHCGEISISPSFIAQKVIAAIDPQGTSQPLVTYGFNLQIRAVARGILRHAFDPLSNEQNTLQAEMFTELQSRYPAKRNGDFVYVLRAEMSLEERQLIPKRLRTDADSRLKHARAFEAETSTLITQGFFNEENNNVAS